jgi:hypothetical protein
MANIGTAMFVSSGVYYKEKFEKNMDILEKLLVMLLKSIYLDKI